MGGNTGRERKEIVEEIGPKIDDDSLLDPPLFSGGDMVTSSNTVIHGRVVRIV